MTTAQVPSDDRVGPRPTRASSRRSPSRRAGRPPTRFAGSDCGEVERMLAGYLSALADAAQDSGQLQRADLLRTAAIALQPARPAPVKPLGRLRPVSPAKRGVVPVEPGCPETGRSEPNWTEPNWTEPNWTEPTAQTMSRLTSRQREVAALVARGLTNRQIADALGISERTAETHVQHIMVKLGFTSRAQIGTLVGRRELAVGLLDAIGRPAGRGEGAA